jgi:serine/threonine protein kinase
MTPERWRQIEEVFQNAVDLPDAERFAYVEQACAGDADLRAEVVSLLESEGIGFLASALQQAAQSVSGVTRLEGQKLGVWRIGSLIGEGGMGTVYQATRADGQFEQTVAVKIIRPGAASALHSRRFLEERNMLAQLKHPFIAQLIDGGEHAGIPYLVMELIDGIRIDEYARQWNLTVNDRLTLFLQVCDAVQYAHSSLIVHRDLKPSNILVTKDGVPKLLDFGIATLIDSGSKSSNTGWMMMTPDYASPEQVTGQPITVASDVYSLGIILYELLTGERPYTITNFSPGEIERAVCATTIQPPSNLVLKESRLRRQLRGDLDNILLMALRKEPNRRYASVAQFAEDIRRHLDGQTVIARPDTFSYRASKFIRRNKLSLGLAAAVVLTILSGFLLTAREFIRAQRRFEEVRSLANSLLNEIDPEAAHLLGSARMRRLVVEKSLTYLDRLSAEAGDDVELRKELARAYHRVGDIQGHPRGDNLGLFNEALQSHLKAIALEEPLFETYPNDAALRRSLAMGYARIADLESHRGNGKVAERLLFQAYKLADQSDPNTYIDVRMSINRSYFMEGRLEEALRYAREGMDLAMTLDNPLRRIVAASYMGSTQQFLGDAKGFRRTVELGLQAFDQLRARGEMTGDQQVREASLYADMGEMLSCPDQPEDENPRAAVPWLEKAAAMQIRFLNQGAFSAGHIIGATTALNLLSAAQARLGMRQALETARKAEEIYSSRARRENPNLVLYLGYAHLRLGNLAEARKQFEQIRSSDFTAIEYLAEIEHLDGNDARALALLAEAREAREPELKRSSFNIRFNRYRQASNIARAIAWGDETPGLRKQGLAFLADFDPATEAASVTRLRRMLMLQ